MSQKTSRRPSFDLRLHWQGVSSQNMQCFRWNTVEVVGLGSVWMLSRGASHEGPRAPLKIYFARLGLRSTCGHPAAQRRPPDQLPPLVERLSIAKWGQGVQESTFPFKWDGKFFRKFSTIVGNASPQSTFCVLPTKSARRPSHYTYGTRAWRREWRKRGRCSPVVAL